MTFYKRSGDSIDRGLVRYWKLNDLQRIPVDGIVAHYKMNDKAFNTVVIDVKGGNNGTFSINTEARNVGGKINDAFDLNGTTDNIAVSKNFSGTFSLSLWIKVAAGFSGPGYLFDFRKPSDSGGAGFFWFDADDKLGKSGGQIYVDTVATDPQTFIPTQDTWHHLVLSGITIDGPEGYFIGQRHSGSGFFDGIIDDVRIYEGTLTQAQINTINNSDSGTETIELFRDTIVAIDTAKFNDGTITGTTKTSGINGLNPYTMFFDGIDDQIVDVLEIPFGSFSISAWINFDTTGLVQQIYSNRAEAGGNPIVEFIIGGTENLQSALRSNAGAGISTVVGDTTLVVDTWYHVVVTYDVVSGAHVLYVNGGVDKTGNYSGGTWSDVDNRYIGARKTDTSVRDFWNGKISNVRIYDRSLKHAEVNKLFRTKL